MYPTWEKSCSDSSGWVGENRYASGVFLPAASLTTCLSIRNMRLMPTVACCPTARFRGGTHSTVRCNRLLGLLDEEEDHIIGDIGSLSYLDCIGLNLQRLG